MSYDAQKFDDYLLPDSESLDEFSMFDDGVDDAPAQETLHVSEEWQPLS